MRVFSPPFCGRDGESLSIRTRGGRRAPPPACTGLLRWCQAGPDQAEILPVREGGPERQMDPPRGHRHAHRDLEQALVQQFPV